MSAVLAGVPPASASRSAMGLPFALMLCYMALVYIRPQEYPGSPLNIPLQAGFMAASVLAWLPQRGKSFEAPQHWLLPMFVMAVVISVVFAGWLGGGMIVLMVLAPQLILFAVISTTMSGEARHDAFIALVALVSVVLAIHGVVQSHTAGGIGWSGAQLSQSDRITYIGIFNDPNDLALAFVMAFPLAVYRFGRSRYLVTRLFWLACVGFLLYAMYLANSRGGLIAAGLQVTVFVLLRHGFVPAGVVASAGMLILSLLSSRLDTLDAAEESAAGRIEAWYAGMQMFRAHPFFGVGASNFTEYHELTAHNSFVLAFAELGAFGYFFWLAFVALSVVMAWRVARLPEAVAGITWGKEEEGARARYRKIGSAYLFALLGFLAGAFFLSRTYNVLLTIACAACVALHQDARRRWPEIPALRVREWLFPMVLLEVGSIVGMYVVIRVLLLKAGS